MKKVRERRPSPLTPSPTAPPHLYSAIILVIQFTRLLPIFKRISFSSSRSQPSLLPTSVVSIASDATADAFVDRRSLWSHHRLPGGALEWRHRSQSDHLSNCVCACIGMYVHVCMYVVTVTAFPIHVLPVKRVTWPLTFGFFRHWPYAIAVNT